MNNTGGLLIDLDGTLFHGGQMIPGADKLIEGLRAAEIPFCSSRIIHHGQRQA